MYNMVYLIYTKDRQRCDQALTAFGACHRVRLSKELNGRRKNKRESILVEATDKVAALTADDPADIAVACGRAEAANEMCVRLANHPLTKGITVERKSGDSHRRKK